MKASSDAVLYSPISPAMDIEALYKQGFDLRCAGSYAEAQQVLTRVLSMNPAHIGARHQMALIQGFEGDFDASLASLDGLSRQYPENIDVRYDLAMTQMMLGMYEEACGNLKRILAVAPAHDKAAQQVIYC
ncbi:tetratricopeptide repeat protein [bacterium]|nr:MAG: tetratricopeptide repeat protein [bacterium]